jgi:hypothetical protein
VISELSATADLVYGKSRIDQFVILRAGACGVEWRVLK